MPETMEAPTTIQYTQADIDRLNVRKSYRPGYGYWFKVVDSQRQISKNGHYTIVTMLAALTDPDDPSSTLKTRIRNGLTIPLHNPDFPGHEVANTIGLCNAALRAMLDPEDAPTAFPRYEDGVPMHDGERITKEEYADLRIQAQTDTMDALTKAYADPDMLLDCVFFANVVHKDGYTNVDHLVAEPDERSYESLDNPKEFLVLEGTTETAAEDVAEQTSADERARRRVEAKPAKTSKKVTKKKVVKKKPAKKSPAKRKR